MEGESRKHPAWDVPDVVDAILDVLADRDLAMSARVCRDWTSTVLDKLWKDMDSLQPLLQILGPLEIDRRTERLVREASMTQLVRVD